MIEWLMTEYPPEQRNISLKDWVSISTKRRFRFGIYEWEENNKYHVYDLEEQESNFFSSLEEAFTFCELMNNE